MTDTKHEAPAKGAGEVGAAYWRGEVSADQAAGSLEEIAAKQDQNRLRARSSAPEAREDAQPFAWAYRLNFPDENTAWDWEAAKEKMTEAKFGQHGGILETMPLYTHPAAPSADKLRAALEEIAEIGTMHHNAHDEFDRGAKAARLEAREIALAALKAEA